MAVQLAIHFSNSRVVYYYVHEYYYHPLKAVTEISDTCTCSDMYTYHSWLLWLPKFNIYCACTTCMEMVYLGEDRSCHSNHMLTSEW